MADVSRNTFDKGKNYTRVTGQQNKPLLDADFNEAQDNIRGMLSSTLDALFSGAIFVSDGFKLEQDAVSVNNVKVKAGTIFFKGYPIVLTSDLRYSTQSGVAVLTTPGANRLDMAYLKIELNREVNGAQDPSIVDPSFGETTLRLKNKVTLLVSEGSTVLPADVPASETYYVQIGLIARLAGNSSILTSMLTDNRSVLIKPNVGTRTISDQLIYGTGVKIPNLDADTVRGYVPVNKAGDNFDGPVTFANKFRVGYNPAQNSLDFEYIG